jgi:translocator protein
MKGPHMSSAMPSASLTRPLIVAAVCAIVVGALGGLLTDTGPWYRALKVPAWKPPDWAFGPVWTTIFLLCAVSAALAWRAATPPQRGMIIGLFAANAALNILWSALFFYMRRPDLALYEVPFLWLSILVLILRLWPISKPASVLLLPYLAWVSVASMLNLSIVRLNGL